MRVTLSLLGYYFSNSSSTLHIDQCNQGGKLISTTTITITRNNSNNNDKNTDSTDKVNAQYELQKCARKGYQITIQYVEWHE